MAFAELSITNTTQRRPRPLRNYQSGRLFELCMAAPRMQAISRDRYEPESGCMPHDLVLFTVLESLPDSSIRVVYPLRAVVQPKSGVYMASLVDTPISASGESPAEATESLGDIVAAKFRLFSRKENILGEQLRRQFRVLQQSLRAT